MEPNHELLKPLNKGNVRNIILNNRREFAAHQLWRLIEARDERIKRLEAEAEWYRKRCHLLQQEQKRFGEGKERTLLCDILANGQLMADPTQTRYPQPQ